MKPGDHSNKKSFALEFSVPVWCPFLKGDIDMIEQVQQRATKLILAIRNPKL
jgi:hypothetical protein